MKRKKAITENEKGIIAVTFGTAVAQVFQRGNGYWKVNWREAGKSKSTTKAKREKAIEFAELKVRALDAGQGGMMMTTADHALLTRLKAVSGDRSPFAVLDELESAAQKYGGWQFFSRAVSHYEASGLAKVELVTVQKGFDRLIDSYGKRDPETVETLEKEIGLFCKTYGDLLICDLTEEFVERWVNRRKLNGEVAAPRTHNNRLDCWRTFLNKARKWNYWPQGEKHPGETLERERVAQGIPEIFTVEQATALLKLVQKEEPKALNYFVTACWLGPRPKEILRMTPEMWDWERGYVGLSAKVANKVLRQRFVPIPDNVRKILGGKIEDPRDKVFYGKRVRGALCTTKAGDEISALARKHGIVENWPADVMRHSYISYRLAQGHSRSQVAEWCGNSEAEIRQSYRRPLMKEEGDKWFQIGL
ncbi:tyrosine-type recombinase/integrase [Prosthecobacter dejongeii]|uniref:Integrase n=1 Tax=Prosthecobacter dejongeii TaxID=48465 RepID=A0A7W7YLL9_9BACT|nr:hypothetical protein [Prosthecobacter dejongeii]MBB5038232.1 integrase [Prosthecobacter dejongeii]